MVWSCNHVMWHQHNLIITDKFSNTSRKCWQKDTKTQLHSDRLLGLSDYPTISHIKSCHPMTLCTRSYEKLHSSLFFWAALLALSKDFASMASFGPDHHGQTPAPDLHTENWLPCLKKKHEKDRVTWVIPSIGCWNNATAVLENLRNCVNCDMWDADGWCFFHAFSTQIDSNLNLLLHECIVLWV